MSHRILFAGTPDIAVPLLNALVRDFEVVGVLTSVDKPRGRSKALVPSPVKSAALKAGIPVLQFETLRTEARERVKEIGADTLVSFAFGKIFGPKFLSLFPKGTFNVHPSALPVFRGPSPIQETVRCGLKTAVVSLQEIGLEMDSGDIYASCSFPLTGTETSMTLSSLVAEKASFFVPEELRKVFSGDGSKAKQTGEPVYCKMLEKSDCSLDFSQNVKDVHCKIRALYEWPKASARFVPSGTGEARDIFITGVWGGFDYIDNPDSCEDSVRTDFRAGSVVAIRRDRGIGVLCRDGLLWINALQLPSKKEMDFFSFINGNSWIKDGFFE